MSSTYLARDRYMIQNIIGKQYQNAEKERVNNKIA